MKITLQQVDGGPDEIIIQYSHLTEEIQELKRIVEQAVEGDQRKVLTGSREGRQYPIPLEKIVYFECVENVTYAYLEKEVYRTSLTLSGAEQLYEAVGFIRCSKNMVLNIYRIRSLKSEPCNRIDAVMDNGEHVMISRRFAKGLRVRLKGEKE